MRLLQLNAFRRAAGLEVVTLDPTLSGGCAAHAAYLVKNNGHASTEGLGAHDEDAQLPGFTEDGKKAAKSSNISFGHPPVAAVDCWMNSLFHRIPILDPNLKKVGFGYARGTGRWRWITVLDVERGREKGRTEQIIAFPGDAQKNVPVFLQRGETPDPIPDDKDKQAGYPITITFPLGAMVRAGDRSPEAAGRQGGRGLALDAGEAGRCQVPAEHDLYDRQGPATARDRVQRDGVGHGEREDVVTELELYDGVTVTQFVVPPSGGIRSTLVMWIRLTMPWLIVVSPQSPPTRGVDQRVHKRSDR